MKILPLSKNEYQCAPLQDADGNELDGVIEITDEEFFSLQNGEKCFNAELTALVDYYETEEENEAKVQEAKNELRQLRRQILSAFDKYKVNVQYGIEREAEAEHDQIISWYRDILELKTSAFENVPTKVKYYL